jgi:hypothetical protein
MPTQREIVLGRLATSSTTGAGASVAVGFFFWGQDYGCGYAVAGFHVQEADALGVAAGFADGFGIHADDFAVLADQHDLGVFVYQRDGYYFAYALGGLDIDYAFAGAVGEAVFVGGVRLPYPFSVTERISVPF